MINTINNHHSYHYNNSKVSKNIHKSDDKVKINQLNKSNKNVFEFIKTSIELLLPSLNEESIENVKNAVIFLKNKKEKKGEKKKKEEEKKEVVPKSDRFEERKALYKQYGDGDISQQKPDGEDDYNDDGDFM